MAPAGFDTRGGQVPRRLLNVRIHTLHGLVVLLEVHPAPRAVRVGGDAGWSEQSEVQLAGAVGSRDDQAEAPTKRHRRHP